MKTYIVDSFTDVPFKGNPAGVCFPENVISEQQMLLVAAELGLSETAFIRQTGQADTYIIRYFSPKQEIPLCGHVTLASAKILFTTTSAVELHFITGEKLDLHIKKSGTEITMEFPVYDTVPATVPPEMLSALGITETVNTAFSPKNKIILLEITGADKLAGLAPDFNALINSYEGINGVLVTASGNDAQYEFHYRYFWPWAGTNEDPVTGGVQTFLTRYWSQKLNKKTMKAYQSSGRTGHMTVTLQNDKVLVAGQAVIVFEGNLL